MRFKQFTVKKQINFKNGNSLEVGQRVDVAIEKVDWRYILHIHSGSDEYRCSKRVLVSLGIKEPSLKTLEKCNNDGWCKSIFGKRVEPDGHDEYGSPSWLLLIGVI